MPSVEVSDITCLLVTYSLLAETVEAALSQEMDESQLTQVSCLIDGYLLHQAEQKTLQPDAFLHLSSNST